MVDLGAYVLLLIETKDKRIKLYGSPADKNNLEIGDEVLEINGNSLENYTHDEAIAYIHKCIKSKTICLKVKRKSENDEIDSLNDITDAYAIAVEKKAKERLEKLAAKHNFCPLDMTKLSSADIDTAENITTTTTNSKFDSINAEVCTQIHITESVRITTIATSPIGSLDHKVQQTTQEGGGITNSINNISALTNAIINNPSSDSVSYQRPSISTYVGERLRQSIIDSSYPQTSVRKYSTPSSIYTISGLTQTEQDYLNKEVLSPENFKRHMIAAAPLSSRTGDMQPPSPLGVGGKYMIDLEKRDKNREARERELEFLRSSLRGSKKLQALAEQQEQLQEEGRVQGIPGIPRNQYFYQNEAFSPDRDVEFGKALSQTHTPHPVSNGFMTSKLKPYTHIDLDAILCRMNDLLKSAQSNAPTTASSETVRPEDIENLKFIRSFLSDPKFRTAFEVYKHLFDDALARTSGPTQMVTPDNKHSITANNEGKLPTSQAISNRVKEILFKEQPARFRDADKDQKILLTTLTDTLILPYVEQNRFYNFHGQHQLAVSHHGGMEPNGRNKDIPVGIEDGIQQPNSQQATPQSPTLTHKHSKSLDESVDSTYKSLLAPVPALPGEQIRQSTFTPNYQDDTNGQNGLNGIGNSTPPNVKVVKIDKGPDPLGATIRNDGDAVVIARIINNGAAQRTGALMEGDEILEINGIRMMGKSVHEVCDILSDMNGVLSFVINRPPTMSSAGYYGGGMSQPYSQSGYAQQTQSQQPNGVINSGDLTSPHSSPYDEPMSVRANFNYDPEEDLYIPCRELGLSFQKGDILHVINQDDLNWWQAYRDGEDVQGLAGLIPSKNFQIQRETLKRTLFGTEEQSAAVQRRKKNTEANQPKPPELLDTSGLPLSVTKNKKEKGSTPTSALTSWADDLCGRESLAARLCTSALDYCSPQNNKSDVKGARKYGGWRKRDTDMDEYECDEILTYEEVELFYPQKDKKRPIVFIGPPDIGRHELRQRLMEEFPERFAAAVPHTSRPQRFGEIDGQDYHFLSRQAFEADIMAGKFVEHGEFEKALYGTSLASIRKVIDSGKNCILNLHPQSLKILYHSDLMPYVIFIAPPNLEKLRIIEEKRGVYKKDEELIEIIEKAREIEENFGHYFDVFIINADLGKTYTQILEEINRIECEPQWVPKFWIHKQRPIEYYRGYVDPNEEDFDNNQGSIGADRFKFQHGYTDSGIVNHAFNPSFDLQPYDTFNDNSYNEHHLSGGNGGHYNNNFQNQNVLTNNPNNASTSPGGYYTFDSRDYRALNQNNLTDKNVNDRVAPIFSSSSKQNYIS